MNAQRILAVVAAILFVGAVGLATAQPQMISLGGLLSYVSSGGEGALRDWLTQVLGPWPWNYVVSPLLLRPAWLPFGALGLICAGVALTLPARDASRRSHRRS